MKQVFLSGQGQIDVLEAPVPSYLSGGILVQNAFSFISAGTEGAAITKNDGLKGLYEKILKSRNRADQVWSMVQTQGLSSTLELIKGKLGDHTPLGYSCAGVILETDGDRLGFKSGQRVACMGAGFANHAEYVVIPKNLAVSLPDCVSFADASFASFACIAMQGIRRLELSPGERIAIVGLGQIGQIALRLAIAMGYQAYGLDINEQRVAHAKQYSDASLVMNSTSGDPVSAIHDITGGVGVDGVVICASAKVDAIINQAFSMCRKRGRISVVGDIGLGLERAKMYAKELEVRLSCSYGSGRYDPDYELSGIDYPLPYARWTERRNLEYFITLLAEERLNLSDLVSAKIAIEEAKDAYSLIKSGNASVYGVLLDYHLPDEPALPEKSFICLYDQELTGTGKNTVQIGLIGVGGYAKNVHVPNICTLDGVKIRGVASKSGGSAAVVAKKTKAAYATSDIAELLADNALDAVVISTRHASHAGFVLDALAAGKHVFVEKPMATTVKDCLKIVEAQQVSKCIVRVGFNRRYAPYLQQMKQAVGQGQKLFNIRVNVGPIGDHWSNTAEEGGRLLGEGVHFFDLANWMIGCVPVSVTAQYLGEVSMLNPDAIIIVRYEDGSIANIVYTTIGNTARGKEYFELFGNGRTVVVDDYKKMKGFGCNVVSQRKDRSNKGQLASMEEFTIAVKSGKCGKGADAVAGVWATVISVAALRSAETNCTINIAQFVDNEKAN